MANKLEIDIGIVEQLACKGYTNAMIFTAVGCSLSYGQRNNHIMHAIKKGREVAKSKVIDSLFAHAADPESTPAAAIYLSKVLKVFSDPFPTSKPKTVKEVLERMNMIYLAVARNELSTDKADKLISYLDKIATVHEVTALEARITALEDNKDKEHG